MEKNPGDSVLSQHHLLQNVTTKTFIHFMYHAKHKTLAHNYYNVRVNQDD